MERQLQPSCLDHGIEVLVVPEINVEEMNDVLACARENDARWEGVRIVGDKKVSSADDYLSYLIKKPS